MSYLFAICPLFETNQHYFLFFVFMKAIFANMVEKNQQNSNLGKTFQFKKIFPKVGNIGDLRNLNKLDYSAIFSSSIFFSFFFRLFFWSNYS